MFWLFVNCERERRRVGRELSKRGSNNHHSATRSHGASAGPSINARRKCFPPTAPLGQSILMTPLVQASVTVSDLSDSPAPSHLQDNWQPLTLTLKPACLHAKNGTPFWSDGSNLFLSFFINVLLWSNCRTLHKNHQAQIKHVHQRLWELLGRITGINTYLLYIMYAVNCWSAVYFNQANRYANEDQVTIFICCMLKQKWGVCVCLRGVSAVQRSKRTNSVEEGVCHRDKWGSV